MADNSNNRKKTLLVSMLAFLLVGGGVFLFFIIQGSEDLKGAGKNSFTYGNAAREGVSSFFKSIGLVPDEEGALAKQKVVRMEERGFLEDGEKAAADLSDWMANDSPKSAPSRPGASVVPKMSAGRGSAVGGGGGGGSKSAGGVSRFGDGSSSGSTGISARSQAGAGGTAGSGTLASLKNARAILGSGLSSNSAMTARSKWGQSFGLGSGGGKSGGDMHYKSGLVNLDKIKSGQIASLKAAPAAGEFQRDKEAESKDPTLNAAKEKAKADMEAEAKKAAIQAAADAAANAASQTPEDKGGGGTGTSPNQRAEIPANIQAEADSLTRFQKTDLPSGASFQDTSLAVTSNADGSYTYTMTGKQTIPGDPPKIEEYTDVVVRGKDGKLTWK